MARYSVQDAITYAQAICVGIPVGAIQVMAADQVNSIIWNCYPWRWAQNSITAIPLVDGTQDYTFAPTDYMRLVAMRLVRTDVTPDAYDELQVVRNLAPDLARYGFQAGLSQIAMVPALGKIRLSSAAAVPTGMTVEIQGEYQFQPAKITTSGATLPFPDQYFNVFCEGLLWQFYALSKDSRQGTTASNGRGGVTYTGQMGAFYDALIQMRGTEDWGAGDNIFPSDPLGVSGSVNYATRIYGF